MIELIKYVFKHTDLRHLQFLLCLSFRIALDGLSIALFQIEIIVMASAEIRIATSTPVELSGHWRTRPFNSARATPQPAINWPQNL
jgi:hypothetical protein